MANTVNKPTYAKVLHSDEKDAHNSFNEPNNVHLEEFKDYQINNNEINIALKDKSIVTLVVHK